MALDERHHTILQSLMSRGPQHEGVVKNMFKRLFELHDSDNKFLEFQAAYNKALDVFQIEIRASKNQYDGSTYYGLVNKQGSEQAKLGTQFSYAQVVFFKAIVEAIANDPAATGQLSSIKALQNNLDTQADEASAALSKSQKEKSVADFVSNKWLERTSDGFIRLGVRTFLELRSLFKNLDVPFCEICNEAAIKATRCQNDECDVRMHVYCSKIKFERSEPPWTCPKCDAGWDCSALNLQAETAVKGGTVKRERERERAASARKSLGRRKRQLNTSS